MFHFYFILVTFRTTKFALSLNMGAQQSIGRFPHTQNVNWGRTGSIYSHCQSCVKLQLRSSSPSWSMIWPQSPRRRWGLQPSMDMECVCGSTGRGSGKNPTQTHAWSSPPPSALSHLPCSKKMKKRPWKSDQQEKIRNESVTISIRIIKPVQNKIFKGKSLLYSPHTVVNLHIFQIF